MRGGVDLPEMEARLSESRRLGGCSSKASTSDSPEAVVRLDIRDDRTAFVPFDAAEEDDLAVIMHTSGTTARPKGVARSPWLATSQRPGIRRGRGAGRGRTFLNMLPMSYMAGLLNLTLLPFVVGGSTVAAPAFELPGRPSPSGTRPNAWA